MAQGQGGMGGGYGRIGFATGFDVASRPWPGPQHPAAQQPRYAGAPVEDSYVNAATAGQVAGAYAAQQDVRVRLAKAQAELENMQATLARLPRFAQSIWQGRIDVKAAEIQALQQKLALTVEGEGSQRDWRVLGKAGAVVAVVGGIGLVTLIGIAIAHAVPRRNR